MLSSRCDNDALKVTRKTQLNFPCEVRVCIVRGKQFEVVPFFSYGPFYGDILSCLNKSQCCFSSWLQFSFHYLCRLKIETNVFNITESIN